MIQIQDNISEQKNLKDKLESEQEKLHVEYNKVSGISGPFPCMDVCECGSVCAHAQTIHTQGQLLKPSFFISFINVISLKTQLVFSSSLIVRNNVVSWCSFFICGFKKWIIS